MRRRGSSIRNAALLAAFLFLWQTAGPALVFGYVLTYTVGDLRLSPGQSGGTACPHLNRFSTTTTGVIDRRWSTSLGTAPVTILTADPLPTGRLNEIEAALLESYAAWTGVAGTTLAAPALAPLNRTPTPQACQFNDGLNSICLNQSDLPFAGGVLAFARVVTSDIIGEPFPNNPPSSFIGEILDADILLKPGDGSITFATPAALGSNQSAFDLETIVAHELGHVWGFSHSAVWGAMMFPFAPPRGQFLGERPTAQLPDAPLSEDDRTGLRALYPDPADTLRIGSIEGRILPANPLSLAGLTGVSGMFGAHVVVVDDATGAVVAAALAGWSCSGAGTPQFDGSYRVERLPVGPDRRFRVFVEPLDGPVVAGNIAATTESLCRNQGTDPGWPLPQACTVPEVNSNFATRVRP